MPPLHLLVEVLLYAVLPAALTAAALMAIAALAGGPKLAPVGAALGLAAGVVVGGGVRELVQFQAQPPAPGAAPFHFLHSLELAPGDSPWNRLPWAAVAALLVGLLARVPLLNSSVAWSLRWAVTVVVVSWVLPGRVRGDVWWLAPAFTLAILAQWALLEHLAARPAGGSIPLALALTAFVAGVVLVYAGAARLMDMATVLAAALGGVAAVSWWRRVDGGGAIPGAVVLLLGLLLMGHQETVSEVPWPAFALAAGAPLVLALALLPPFRAWQPGSRGGAKEEAPPFAVAAGHPPGPPPRFSWESMRAGLLRLALVLVPLAVAAVLTHVVAGPLQFE